MHDDGLYGYVGGESGSPDFQAPAVVILRSAIQAGPDLLHGAWGHDLSEALPLLLRGELADCVLKRHKGVDFLVGHFGDKFICRCCLTSEAKPVAWVLRPLGLCFFHADKHTVFWMYRIGDEVALFVSLLGEVPDLPTQPGSPSPASVIGASEEKSRGHFALLLDRNPERCHRVSEKAHALPVRFTKERLRVVLERPRVSVVERALGVSLEGPRVREAPTLELECVDAQHPAMDASLDCWQDSHPSLAKRKSQPSGGEIWLEDQLLIVALTVPFPRGCCCGLCCSFDGFFREFNVFVVHVFLFCGAATAAPWLFATDTSETEKIRNENQMTNDRCLHRQ